VVDPAASKGDDYHRQLGFVAATMTKSSQYCEYPLACLAVWIEPAILLGQIHFFRDLGNNVVGYMTWALLAQDTEQRLIHDPEVLLHFSEWNEGDRLWIMDFVLLDGSLRPILKEAYQLFPFFQEAKSVRRRADGIVRKVTTWRR
jgi:hemolysin-activating ACP:hemolysin acyltransferase